MAKIRKARILTITIIALVIATYLLATNTPTQQAVEETELPLVEFSVNLLRRETINTQETEHVFSIDLNERTRFVVEGTFENPVSFILLSEQYYPNWVESRVVGISVVYIKDYEKDFYARFDVNEGAGGKYYLITQSLTPINGEIRLFQVAKL